MKTTLALTMLLALSIGCSEDGTADNSDPTALPDAGAPSADADTDDDTSTIDADPVEDAGAEEDGSPEDDVTEPPHDFQAAADYSALHGGAAVLAMIDGQIVFEQYANGADAQTATHLHSATKAFWTSVFVAAVEDGLIDGVDEKVCDTLTEWRDPELHPGKDAITILHLLELTSGLSQDIRWIQGKDPMADDIYQHAIDELRLLRPPGERFQYGPSHYYAFGAMLQRKLIEAGLDPDPLHYLQTRILDPIGVEIDHWIYDPAGNPHIPNGSSLTPRNVVRFGQLLLQRGQWEGESIVSGQLLDEMRTPGSVNPGHGRFLWLNVQGGYGGQVSMSAPPDSPGGFIYHDGHPDMFAALGAGKNRMYMFPSLDMIVVRQTLLDDDEYEDHDFLSALFDGAP